MLNKISLYCFLVINFLFCINSVSSYSQNTDPKLRLSLINTNNNLFDETVIYFTNNATDGYDYLYDAIKLMNAGNTPNIYSIIPGITGGNLAINGLPPLTTDKLVKLGVQSPVDENGTFVIKADSIKNFPSKTGIYLMDSLLGKTYKIIQSSIQSFTYNSSNSKKRFSLCFDVEGIGTPTSLFNINPNPVQAGDTAIITFTGTASSDAKFTWNFDGGTYKGTGSGPYKVVWNTTGSKKISLGIKGTCFSSTTTTKTVKVKNLTHANITPAGPISICYWSSVTLQANKGTGFLYRWKKNTIDIAYATSDSYNVSESGSYSVVITGTDSVVTSNPVIVKVNPLPVVTVIPSGIINADSVLLTANSMNIITSYQWYKNDTLINKATNSTYEAKPTGLYSVSVIDNNGCSNNSNFVQVNPPLIETLRITELSANPQSVCPGEITLIQVSVTGGIPPYNYQWSPSNFGNVSSISDSPFKTTTYKVTVSDLENNIAITDSVTVTVIEIPNADINSNGPTTICTGSSVTLNPAVSDIYSYQWKMNGSNIQGATRFIYTANQAGSYSVILSKNNCSKESNSLNITVTTITANVTPYGPINLYFGQDIVLNANTGIGNTYQWYKDGQFLQGQNSNILDVNETGTYYIIIKNNGCTKQSNTVNVIISQLEIFITPPGPISYTPGEIITLTAIGGLPGSTYQWYKNDTLINNATGITYDVTSIGRYYVITTTSGSLVTSNTVIVFLPNICPQVSEPKIIINEPGRVVLSWTANSPDQTYIVRVAKINPDNSYDFNYLYRVTTATTATFTILEANTKYRWTVKAWCGVKYNNLGYIPNSFFTTQAAGCLKAKNLSHSNVTTNSAFISWTSLVPTATYKIRYCILDGWYHWKYRKLSSNSLDLLSLKSGSWYIWQAKTICGGGNQTPYSEEVDTFKTTGISGHKLFTENSEITDLIVYPNPSDGLFSITVSGTNNPVNVIITDIEGREIYNQMISGNISKDMDLSSLAKGLYYIRLIKSNKVLVKKILIQ